VALLARQSSSHRHPGTWRSRSTFSSWAHHVPDTSQGSSDPGGSAQLAIGWARACTLQQSGGVHCRWWDGFRNLPILTKDNTRFGCGLEINPRHAPDRALAKRLCIARTRFCSAGCQIRHTLRFSAWPSTGYADAQACWGDLVIGQARYGSEYTPSKIH